MFALQIIFVLIVISGLIAFIGDRLGHIIGRKRLTIFNLRPRHTAIAITIITGILIALATGTILFMSSADVRTALFGLDSLKRMISEKSRELDAIKSDKAAFVDEINNLQKTLDNSKKEMSDLIRTKERLLKEIKTARSGSLFFKVNDVITNTVIDSSADKKLTKEKLTKILADTDVVVKSVIDPAIRGGKKHYIVMPTNELDEAVDYITSHPGGIIVRIISASNAVLGEEIPVHFELFENLLIFKKGQTITSAVINGGKSIPEIEQDIKELLSKVNEIALRQGVIPDPAGSVGNISYARIFEISKALGSKKKLVPVSIEAIKNIFAAGPLEIDLKITP